MQISLAALSLLLLSACCSQIRGAPLGASPSACCFNYSTKPIPQKLISDYYFTSSHCSNPGVIFKTIKGRSICSNPSDQWVKDYLINNGTPL
ncbi:C-C motif chemokine 3 [Bombina bombina]|uniref:C-C motif chemokine 3 n=1 Tax=Bombina bombina TaxID=8345 RepID=UPI00235A5326|nr:C-C motif chemokine 3 [Bombina bombina]